MLIKNNYNECLTNLACSIQKYFELEYRHNTLNYIDKVLEEYQPKNVVTILCDGMGSVFLKRVLKKDDFLNYNLLKDITTVFPATTVAATTSMMTGLNPCETGMLGWNMYYKDIDKIITTFRNSLKGDFSYKQLEEAINYKKNNMITKTIMEKIIENGKYKSYTLFPFGETPYKNIDEMYQIINKKCHENGKKYIYAYDVNPDKTMHVLGNDSDEVADIIKNINNKVESLSENVNDTIIFVVADHGHINVENIFLKDYPDILECLKMDTSLESRAVNFFINEGMNEQFVKLFQKYFTNHFDLYSKKEVIDSKLFGTGIENRIFRDALGDYLAIANGNKALISDGMRVLKSQHAGYTEDEINVPLVLVKTKK